MNTKRKAATVAVAGTAAGALGLGLLAMPAGADSAPELPEIGAQQLVGSVLKAQPPAMSGTATVDNELGIPAVPGVPALDAQSARVYYDGDGKGRVALEQESSELTYVLGEKELWSYDSAEGTATRTPLPAGARGEHRSPKADGADPARAATQVVDKLEESSNVSVDGTARVAGRAAYELVLTPKPDERTLVREVRVAVDAEERLPLRMSVLTHGTTEPAFEIGFSEVEFGPQPERLFEFSPPEGTEVTESEAGRPEGHRGGSGDEPQFRTTGDGWDTVVLTRVPQELRDRGENGGTDVEGMLDRFGKPVQGEFGSGHVIETRIGTALITEDGRLAAGAVPEQVLRQALENR
ncbi:LolA family protein [Prauserella alba]|uniref:Sigma-E factor regulatory protein RseB domain-containing protein n=1 Tax=Prauserella alba TaxID=176898 RepID=A0ABP4G637_9PSEU|nr:sigma-E factor regulatory protein RseB domain-containing protein [Prauserella alba]MCP2181069.1 Outer membrane lipoprotein-sorting protein [Prauserella alba]